MFNATECKSFQWVHKCPGGKTSKDVGSIMIEVCTECFENRKKGQIVQHVKMKKGGWRYQRFLRGGYMWFKIRHFPPRLIIAWTMFLIQCLRHLGISQNLCQVTLYHHLRKKKVFWDCIFFSPVSNFWEKFRFISNFYTRPCVGPTSPWVKQQSASLAPTHMVPQEDEFLLPSDFPPETIKYV